MIFDLAVEEEILDLEDAEAIMDYTESLVEEERGIIAALRAAVGEEVLSQDIAEDILAYLDECKPNADKIEEDTKGLSREEMREYMKVNMPEAEVILDDLMVEGFISSRQAEDLGEILSMLH